MRKSKSFKIEGRDKEYEIKELTLREIIGIFQGDAESSEEANEKPLLNSFKEDLLPKCSNIKSDELLDFTPSEIEIIYDHFKEVNKTFFDVARTAGLGKMMEKLIGEITEKYSDSFVNLLKPDTQEP